MAKRKVVYWDACVFIALLKRENRQNNELDGVLDCVDSIVKNHVTLVTSADVIAREVRKAKMTDEAWNEFNKLFYRKNIKKLSPNARIPGIKQEIIDYYKALSAIDGKKPVGDADAEHLATAICYDVDAFYTFDNGKKGTERGLLELDGNVAGHYPLKICKPPVQQIRLFYPE